VSKEHGDVLYEKINDVDFSADIPSHDVVLLKLSPVKQGD